MLPPPPPLPLPALELSGLRDKDDLVRGLQLFKSTAPAPFALSPGRGGRLIFSLLCAPSSGLALDLCGIRVSPRRLPWAGGGLGGAPLPSLPDQSAPRARSRPAPPCPLARYARQPLPTRIVREAKREKHPLWTLSVALRVWRQDRLKVRRQRRTSRVKKRQDMLCMCPDAVMSQVRRRASFPVGRVDFPPPVFQPRALAAAQIHEEFGGPGQEEEAELCAPPGISPEGSLEEAED